jgi:ankyrin repeat protein
VQLTGEFMKTGLIALLLACTAFTARAHAESPNLFAAARTNDVNGARALIANKADVNQQDDKGYTPLIMATYYGSYDVAQFLLDHGAAIEKKDSSGRTALMGASFKGDERDVALLLQHGADANAKDSKGLTSMMYAVMFGRVSVVKLLRANQTAKPPAISSTAN